MELTKKKLKVLRFLIDNGVSSIRDVASKCFPGVRPVTKADSQVRNQLRTLRRDGYALKKARGTYEVSAKGRTFAESSPVETAVETVSA